MFRKIIGVASIVIVVILGYMAYLLFKPPAQASAPIAPIPITAGGSTSTTSSSQPEATKTADTPPTGTPDTASSSGTVIFQVVPADSKVSFTLNEILNGSPNTVIGTTDQVAGEVAINPNDPSSADIGTIQVDARTFVTDNNFRNRIIKNQILNTNQYEYVTFTPKGLVGLPKQVTYGTNYSFKIIGDLTIKGVTKEVTFDATATQQDASHITGSASTTISYSDFGISIPQVPSVAAVDKQVKLEISFSLAAQ